MNFQADRLTTGLALPVHDGIVNTYDGNDQLTKVFYYTGFSGFTNLTGSFNTAVSESGGTVAHSGGTLVATLTMTYNGSNLISVQRT